MPLSINQIPIPVPSSTDPANFSARGDAVFGAFPDFITQTNAVASEAAANRDLAEASKTAAANSETNAATYAANATTSANNASSSSVASLWVSGTTYAINDKRVSPITGQVYRRKTAGAGTTDPSLDSTNWYAVLLDADTQYPSIKPTLNLDFANSGKLDPRITFTRASTATYYDGRTFAKAEENLFLQSQVFSTSWESLGAGTTFTASNATAPDGTTTAATIVTTGAGAGRRYYTTLRNGVEHTISMFVKTVSGATGFTADLQNAQTSPTLTLTSSWQRFVWTVTPTADRTWIDFQLDGAGEFQIWGAQLEQRSSVTAYTPTTTQPITKYQPVLKTASNNEPRFDYDPATLEAKGLLIEESRTNLLLRSENFENAVWVKTGATVIENTATSPDGSIGADKLTESATAGFHSILQSLAIAKNISYSFTVFAKQAGKSKVRLLLNAFSGSFLYADFDLNTGNVIQAVNAGAASGATAVISNVGNGWFKCSVSGTPSSASGTSLDAAIRLVEQSDGYAGDGYSGIYIWGAQLEQGSFATSYIPTTTTAVTRQADNAVMTGTNFSSWYNPNEGTIYSETTEGSQFSNIYVLNNSGNHPTFKLSRSGGSTLEYYAYDGTSFQFLNNTPLWSSQGTKAAFGYKSLDYAGVSQAGNIVTSVGTAPTNISRLTIAGWNGHIRKLTYYPKRLPNYQLQILTK